MKRPNVFFAWLLALFLPIVAQGGPVWFDDASPPGSGNPGDRTLFDSCGGLMWPAWSNELAALATIPPALAPDDDGNSGPNDPEPTPVSAAARLFDGTSGQMGWQPPAIEWAVPPASASVPGAGVAKIGGRNGTAWKQPLSVWAQTATIVSPDTVFPLLSHRGSEPFPVLSQSRGDPAVAQFGAAQNFPAPSVASNDRTYYQKYSFVPNDPYFHKQTPVGWSGPGQWHLINEYTPGLDAGVQGAWNRNIVGVGVTVALVDDCLEIAHEDLAPNYDAADSWDFGQNDPDPSPVYSSDEHGTSVAGVMAARGGNGKGVTGAAPYARLAGLRVDFVNQSTQAFANATLYHSSGANTSIKVVNHSYGISNPFGPRSSERTALATSTAAGTIHLYAAGNDRGTSGEDSNKKDPQSSPDSITVAALGSDGKYAYYSCFGANVFVTAPSSGSSGLFGITTTDRTGSAGYNPSSDTFPNTAYTSTFGGTSSATPLTAGVVALAKQVQPNLNTRFAKQLLARTSSVVDAGDSSATSDGGWKTNAAGLKFNQNYGFGLINADALTQQAIQYAGVTPLSTATTGTVSVNTTIPDYPSNGVTRTFTMTSTTPLEDVLVTLNIIKRFRQGDLDAFLTSPSGTTSRLMMHTSLDSTTNGRFSTWTWTLLDNAFWGENPAGTWTLNLQDEVAAGTQGTWTSYSVTTRMGSLIPAPRWNVDSDGIWSNSANWSGGVPNGPNAVALLGNVATAGRTLTLDVPVTLGVLTFDSSVNYTLAGTQTLTFNDANGTAALNVSNINGNGAHAIAAPISLGVPLTITQASSGTLSLSGNISGAGGLNVAGGTVALSGANTYAGGTAVYLGVLAVSADANLGSGPLTLDGGTLRVTGSAAVSSKTVSLNANSGTFDIVNSAGLTLSGAISGSGNLTKTGSGNLVLGGANSYTGATVVSNGQLAISAAGSLANTAVSVAGGATFAPQPGSGIINLGSTSVSGAGASLSLASGGRFDMTDGAIGTVKLLQSSTFSGAALTLSGGTLNFDLASTGADLLSVSKNASVSGTNTIGITTLGNSLTNGTFMLISAAGGLSGGNFLFDNGAASKTVVIGSTSYTLSLSGNANNEYVGVTSVVSTPIPAISISASQTRFLAGAITSAVISGNVTNSGTADYNFTSIANQSGTTGVLASISPQTGTAHANNADSVHYTAGIDGTGATAGLSYTFGATVSDATPTSASTSTVTLTAVNQRTFSSPPTVALGRRLIGSSVSQGTSITTSGLHGSTTDATLAAYSGGPINGLTLSGGPNVIGGANSADTIARTIAGTVSGAAGSSIGGSFSLSAADELAGSVSNTANVTFTGSAVASRTVTAPAATSLGIFHPGAAVNVTSNPFGYIYGTGGTGDHADTEDTSVQAYDGLADANGITLAGPADNISSAATFTRNFMGTAAISSSGGSFHLAVNPELSPAASVAADYTISVYSGNMKWSGAVGGNWATTGNWTDSVLGGAQVAPGLDTLYDNTDTAIFDGTGAGSPISLNGAGPSLKSIRFSGPTGYTIAKGSGGAITMKADSGNARITASGTASHVISAPINALSNLDLIQSDTASLTLGDLVNAAATTTTVSGTVSAGAISGAGSTSVTGSLTADSIVQDTLSIGAGATVTIRETAGGSASAVPEPSTLALLIAGAAGLLAYIQRRR